MRLIHALEEVMVSTTLNPDIQYYAYNYDESDEHIVYRVDSNSFEIEDGTPFEADGTMLCEPGWEMGERR